MAQALLALTVSVEQIATVVQQMSEAEQRQLYLEASPDCPSNTLLQTLG